ncbi:Uncharacterized protein Adt_40201 [Abeliophyllum distichum]|uniref:Uncharacterized protein n=1 Tax=Abeliophyllum distichum TaxID=126358 RepID=A0ABD1Q7A3_9LAMI
MNNINDRNSQDMTALNIAMALPAEMNTEIKNYLCRAGASRASSHLTRIGGNTDCNCHAPGCAQPPGGLKRADTTMTGGNATDHHEKAIYQSSWNSAISPPSKEATYTVIVYSILNVYARIFVHWFFSGQSSNAVPDCF